MTVLPPPEQKPDLQLINHKTVVIGVCGQAQSGKGVTANYFTALAWRTHNLIKDFELDQYGRIKIFDLKEAKFPKGKIFDPVTFNNDEEVDNILKVCFPHPLNIAQQIAFGDALKESVNIMFGIDSELLGGDDKAKSTETEITAGQFINLMGASKFPFKSKKGSDFLTVREVLQCVGDMVRSIDKNILVKRFTERVYHAIVRKHLGKMEKYRIYANARWNDPTRFIGAVVTDEAKDFAHENGMYVIVQSGEAVEIVETPEGFKAKEW